MRGHEQIITMRLQGVRPDVVFIWCGTGRLDSWKDWHHETPSRPEIEIADGDALPGLDLRFVVGLVVSINGLDSARVAAVHAGCMAAGAKRVLSGFVYFDPSRPGCEGVTGRISDSAAEASCTS